MTDAQNNVAVGLYGVEKRLRRYDCRNRWLRRDLINVITGKRRDGEWLHVLRGIDFEITPGESVAIVGVNGSGKSTLLKLVAGIMQPTNGSISRHGTVCALMDVGTGFQEDLTGRENALVNGAILGLTEKYLKRVMPEIEGFAELEGFLDTPMRYYSSGMRARLGFAVAMNARPDLFIIDEVLAVGDEGFRRKCYKRLDRLASSGTTIMMVSHDMGAVRRLCTRAIWLSDGIVRADGPVEDVCNKYESCFSADGVGSGNCRV